MRSSQQPVDLLKLIAELLKVFVRPHRSQGWTQHALNRHIFPDGSLFFIVTKLWIPVSAEANLIPVSAIIIFSNIPSPCPPGVSVDYADIS